MLDNKISLGAPDNVINKYVTTIDEITDGGKEVENLLFQINSIINNYRDKTILYNIKKRYVKFLMLLMGMGIVDFTTQTEEKLKALEKIDIKLSAFFSTNPKVVNREFIGYSNKVIEELRAIALISKGAQTRERVKNRMKILGYYVQNSEEINEPSGISTI